MDQEQKNMKKFLPDEVVYYKSFNQIERGVVVRQNDYMVFVKFDESVKKLGWHGCTAQSCDPESLVKEEEFMEWMKRMVID